MEIFVYDFDGTIYDGDSSVDFFIYILRKNPISVLKVVPRLLWSCILYFFKVIEKKVLKETYFSFLKYNLEIDSLLEEFWKQNFCKIKPWYLQKKDYSKDVIISASPEFLLQLPAKKIGVFKLIATKVDRETGKFLTENCYGEEKLRRLYSIFPNCVVLESYSDSYSDSFLFDISLKAYFIRKEKIYLIEEKIKDNLND